MVKGPSTATKQTWLRLDPDLHRELRIQAAKEGKSVSGLVREIVRSYIQRKSR